MRFVLIDRVVSRDGPTLVATKSLTADEAYLADHFPGFPVMPGVLMLESLVQAGRLLARQLGHGYDHSPPLVLTQTRQVRFTAMVRPGQTLALEVTLLDRTDKDEGDEGDDERLSFRGKGTVGDQAAVSARFTLAPAPRK